MTTSRLPEFDDAVIRAMAKWPDVPQCFGWLRLDRRGTWRIQNEVIRHARATEFLGRHYRADADGRWYVQNGPQRVFVELDYTPWIFRYDPHTGFSSHNGVAANDIDTVLADDEGNLLLITGLGIGLIDDRDLAAVAELIDEDTAGTRTLNWDARAFPVGSIRRHDVARLNGFVARPQAS